MKDSSFSSPSCSSNLSLPKIILFLFISITLFYSIYTTNIICFPHQNPESLTTQTHLKTPPPISPVSKNLQTHLPKNESKTSLEHIVFGIAASAKLWKQRKNYIKVWWRKNETRGFVWLDKKVQVRNDDVSSLPELRISANVSRFNYTHKYGHRSAIRISRIISETIGLGLENVRWLVMGDDDTFFVVDNLIRVLEKYDHNQFYYIGSNSETHLQNIMFSYNMGYGGGGFAISYGLAKALTGIQDRCIQKYPGLYGSDDRIQACVAELGVPLTKELGFHQFDILGNPYGILAAHPVTPLVSLHHLDIIHPIFPNANRVQSLQRLKVPIRLDSASLMQQSICYDGSRGWTVSVSWGYAVQIIRGIVSPREMERPSRTFRSWYQEADPTGFAFNTRSFEKDTCWEPFVYFLSNAIYDDLRNWTASEYVLDRVSRRTCSSKKGADPSEIHRVEVYKTPDPFLWDKAPRRNCCRINPTKKKGTLVIHVGECREGEIIEVHSENKNS
ncbi:Protein of unknown function DUF604 [Dillenia turbinata]|uniref:Uncharacterized protein n=1 Tax=Dillenia turbinata TaxID=194707 RepID=A0AAN8UVE7_9MAGN